MKYEELKKAGSRFLLVPSLSHTMSSHPLKYVDSLVYGCLIYRSRKSTRERVAGISKRLGIDRSTVQASLKKLVHLGCVQQHPDGYEAVEPQGVCRELFTWKKEPQSSWQSQFSYDRTYLPTKESGLTTIQNGLFWRLVSLAVPVDGGCGQLMIGPGARVSAVSNEYLAKGLRCSRKTVAAGLQYLQKQGLIKVHLINGRRRFVVGILPLVSHVHRWRSRQPKQQAAISFEDLFGQATNAVIQPDVAYRPHIFERLAKHGVPSKTQEEIAALVDVYCIPDLDLNRILQTVKKDHKRNRDKNPILPDHCGQLLLAELTRRGESGEWRIFSEGITSTILTSSEMQVRDYLNGMKVCSNAYRLLRQISVDKSVELMKRARLPVTFCWDNTWEQAKKSQDFHDFRNKVADYLFPSNKKPGSEWLEEWFKCERVPEIDSWPNDLIPLPQSGRGFINTVHSWAREVVGCDDLDAATLTNGFIRRVRNEKQEKWSSNASFNRWRVLQHLQEYAESFEQPGLIDQFFE